MRFLNAKITLFLFLLLIVLGCSTTKKVPEGEFLLKKNEFNFEGKDKPFQSSLPEYVKQKPNGGGYLSFLPFKLMLYNLVSEKFDTTFTEYYDLTKKNRTQESLDSLLVKNNLNEYLGRNLWLKRLVYSSGEPPVLIDTAMSSFSESNLEQFYADRGYRDALVTSSHEFDTVGKKGKVIYDIVPGEESIIKSYEYTISDSAILRHYETLLRRRGAKIIPEKRFDIDDFILERDRISEYLKNRGYYEFNDDGMAIEFTADTTVSDKELQLTLLIPKEREDSLYTQEKFSRYRYGNIHVYPDSDEVAEGKQAPIYYDTIYDGYHLHYVDPKMKYRPKFFTDALAIRDSSLYRLTAESNTKRNIFKRDGISMTRYKNTKNEVELIKGDKTLDVDLYFRPKKKYDFFYGAELSWSEFMNFGVSPQVSLVARNLFRGGEDLETTVRGTLGNVNKKFTDDSSFFNAFEMTFQTKLKFPYLFFPFNLDKVFPKRYYKESDLRLGASVQRNIGLGRITYSTGIDYNISFRDTHSHTLSILNTEFVNNDQNENYFNVFEGDNAIKNYFFNNYYFMYNPGASIDYFNGVISDQDVFQLIHNDPSFLQTLDEGGVEAFTLFENMNFRRQTITQNVLISSMIYQYVLNQSERPNVKNPWYFRGRVELAGNVLSLLDNAFGFEKVGTGQDAESGAVFGVPYSQFIKFDIDIRKYFPMGSKSTLATRMFAGIVQPYGNTDFIPFVRSYTAGGANDVRAWEAATLGPAAFPRYSGGTEMFAIERLKLLFSTEYRFPLLGIFESALFVDAGNIWGTNKDNEITLFKFDEFYKELGIGGGLGLRLDFTYFLLRFDLAYKFHDPSYSEGNRWRFKDINLLKPRLSFGINYPF